MTAKQSFHWFQTWFLSDKKLEIGKTFWSFDLFGNCWESFMNFTVSYAGRDGRLFVGSSCVASWCQLEWLEQKKNTNGRLKEERGAHGNTTENIFIQMKYISKLMMKDLHSEFLNGFSEIQRNWIHMRRKPWWVISINPVLNWQSWP